MTRGTFWQNLRLRPRRAAGGRAVFKATDRIRMPRKDIIHQAVKNSLLKDGWTITADPYLLEYGAEDSSFGDCRMDRVERHREIIHRLMEEYQQLYAGQPDAGVETAVICDDAHG